MDAEKLGKATARAFIREVINLICIVIVFSLFIRFPLNYFRWEFNETDNYTTGERSGLYLLTDYGTGLQYLKTSSGDLVPRLGPDGKQLKVGN